MRIKSLSILASFLVFSLAITSCLDSDNDYELSSDNLITAFSLDTIYGKTYKFTIDQINGLIYNVDSVPHSADTIINRILIKTLTTNGYLTAGPNDAESFSQDTMFYHMDSIDFIKHKPLHVRVRSFDGLHTKPYKIEVRIHRVDPDTLVWGNDTTLTDDAYIKTFTGGKITNATESKAVLLGDDMLVFASTGSGVIAYKRSSEKAFQEITPLALPTDFNVSSIRNFNKKLYAIGDGKVYGSIDGVNWDVITSDASVVSLITTFNETIAGTLSRTSVKEGVNVVDTLFATATVNADGSLTWTTGTVVPADFPTEHIVATKSYITPTGGQQVLLIGEPENGETTTTPWFSKDGLNWGKMVPSKEKYALPAMKKPSILYYGNTIYAFGSTEDDGFSSIYTSVNGIVWEKIKKKFMFPLNGETSAFKDRTGGYAMVVDKDNYIWMFWNEKDDAWRGKLNRLGFDIK